jgi:uncharacterized protein (DUF1697 family)
LAQLVALLRGINLGPRNRVGMADLRDLLEEMGFDDVRTHLQSGNVIVSTTRKPNAVARAMEKGIADRFGCDIDVMVRTKTELKKVVAADPMGKMAKDPSSYQVIFLQNAAKKTLKDLERTDWGAEKAVVIGREVYLWCPSGTQGSRLLRQVGKLDEAKRGTMRNWRTVTRLADMLDES